MLYFLPHRPDDKRQREQTRGGGACEGDERAGKLPQRKRRRGADRAGHGGKRQTGKRRNLPPPVELRKAQREITRRRLQQSAEQQKVRHDPLRHHECLHPFEQAENADTADHNEKGVVHLGGERRAERADDRDAQKRRESAESFSM